MAALSALDWRLRLLSGALVAGSVGTGMFFLARTNDSETESPSAVATTPRRPATASVTPTSSATPTEAPAPTELPTAVPATPTRPVPTADTRIAIRDLPRPEQIQLGSDGTYFITDRGDGCAWTEAFRVTGELGEDVVLRTDCPADFQFLYRPATGEVFAFIS